MKKLMSIFVVVLFIFSACEKEEYMDPDIDPGDGDDFITIKVSSDESGTVTTQTTAAGETMFMVESNKKFIFSYETDIQVSYVIWKFWDEEESYEDNPIYFYSGYDIKPVTLTIVDNNGQSYQVTAQLNLFPRYPDSPFYITDIEESGDKYLITAGIYKNAWHAVSGNYYFIGSITNWDDYQMINPVDTNYRMSADGQLHIAEGVGHWVKTQLELYPGDHNFGVVRFIDNDPIWGNFKNSNFINENEPTLISFHITEYGEIIPVTPLPGEDGDQGPSAVLRFTINSDNSVTIYVNLNGLFSQGNPWWSYLDHNEQWYSPLALDPVGNFPNWGKLTIGDINDFPVIMIWGLYEDAQNDNMSLSKFWDYYYKYIYLHILGN